MKSNIRDIGKALVEQAENKPSSARGMVDDLFPFIYAVHKRMSARAISKWLEEQQQLKLSYTTILKVLKEADERMLKHFTEMRAIENELGFVSSEDKNATLLFDEDSFEGRVSMGTGTTAVILRDEFGVSEAQHNKLINRIRNEWFDLPEAYREACKKFIVNENRKETAESGQKGNNDEATDNQ